MALSGGLFDRCLFIMLAALQLGHAVRHEHEGTHAKEPIRFGDFMGLMQVPQVPGSSALLQMSGLGPAESQMEGTDFIRESSKQDTLDAWLGGAPSGKSNEDVPNLVHLIHVADRAPDWHYFNHLHVKAAMEKFKPDAMYLYYHAEPKGKYWDQTIATPGVHRVHIDKDLYTTFLGHPVHVGAHHADKLRLMTLLKHGGVYLDTDVLALKDFSPLRKSELRKGGCAMVGEEPGGLGNSLIASTPNCKFLRLWWQNYTDFKDEQWGEHSIVRPGRIAKDYPELLKVMPMHTFTPFYPGGKTGGPNAPRLFQQASREAAKNMPGIQSLISTPSLLQSRRLGNAGGSGAKSDETFTMHLFAQYNQGALKQVTEENRCKDDTLYNRLTQLSSPC